jgi:Na+-transporting NADH:ubiquinone oxidoreductase subunit C
MNKDSNGFTFGFAVVMVVVVAVLLSVAAIGLKPYQNENQKQEKMMNILSSLGVKCEMKEAAGLFNKYVKERIILNINGEVIAQKNGEIKSGDFEDAFNIDVQKEYKEKKAKARKAEDMHFPLFICDNDGKKLFVVPMVGTGLWGPIWGYVSFEEDMNTVFGATFDHKTETPGLGAEINQLSFQEQFKGEKIFDSEGNFTSIIVVKGGASAEDKHGVDAITGGTITSNGVTDMLRNTLSIYVGYFKSLVSAAPSTENNNTEVQPAVTDTAKTPVI